MGGAETYYFYAPDSLTGTGVLKHILPRFSLKHNIRVGLAPIQAQADVVLGKQKAGSPAFQSGSEIWYVSVQGEDASDFAERFRDWITSEIEKSAIESFVSSDGITFSTQFDAALLTPQETELVDVTLGHQIAMKNCGRCHAIDETNRKNYWLHPFFCCATDISRLGNPVRSFFHFESASVVYPNRRRQ